MSISTNSVNHHDILKQSLWNISGSIERPLYNKAAAAAYQKKKIPNIKPSYEKLIEVSPNSLFAKLRTLQIELIAIHQQVKYSDKELGVVKKINKTIALRLNKPKYGGYDLKKDPKKDNYGFTIVEYTNKMMIDDLRKVVDQWKKLHKTQ